MKMKFFIVCLFLTIIFVNGYKYNVDHNLRTKKINKRVKMMSRSLESVLTMLEKMRKQRDQCETSVTNMTQELRELSEKIDDNIGGFSAGAPHIDVTDKENRTDGRPVRVDVTSAFDDCLKSLNLDIMTKENAYIWCLRVSLWQFGQQEDAEIYDDDEDLELLQVSTSARTKRRSRFIRRRIAPRDMTQPPSGFRVRREYRTLSIDERERFHFALNILYMDGTIECFSRVHRNAIRSRGAHRGVAFLPWHRAFITLFEEALRQVDSSVFLPYWDSSIDDNMGAGPGLSVMWDDDHLGRGNGIVNSGPFAGWVTTTSPLRRAIARGAGSLIRQFRINTVMWFCRLGEFTRRWENAHNGVHRWVGGTMARSLAASDPVFYMHHAFIDYQWEKFREHQWSDCGVDPAFDYPPTSDRHHQAETPMDGMSFLINRDGIADYWTTNWYNYEDTPTCATDCGNSPDMFCDNFKNLCTGEIRFDLGAGRRKKRQVPQTSPTAAKFFAAASRDECKSDLYSAQCGPPPPATEEEFAERMLRREIQLPSEIEMVDEALQRENEEYEKSPPLSEKIFFHSAPDEPTDCRTADTCVYDLLTTIIKGRQVTKKDYSGF